jgi:protein required for attachment to host cells
LELTVKRSRWILIADDSKATIYRTDPKMRELEQIHHMESPDARAHNEDLITGDRGRNQAPQNRSFTAGTPGDHGSKGGHHGIDPHTERKTVEAEKFVREVAAWLHKAATRRETELEELIVVAPPATLGRIREELSTPVQHLLRCTLAKDYTNEPLQRLPERLVSQLGEELDIKAEEPQPGLRKDVPFRPQKGNQQPAGK